MLVSFFGQPTNWTVFRVVAIPALVLLLYAGDWYGGAWSVAVFLLFVAAGISDWIDGYLARSKKRDTPLGKWADPVADKLLSAAMLLVFLDLGYLSIWPVLLIVLREILVPALRELMESNKVSLPVTRLAKWKTVVQFVAFAVLSLGGLHQLFIEIGVWAVWLALGFTLVTGAQYAVKVWREGLLEIRPRG
jgi:cardiolipin synthase (CMP-forming)